MVRKAKRQMMCAVIVHLVSICLFRTVPVQMNLRATTSHFLPGESRDIITTSTDPNKHDNPATLSLITVALGGSHAAVDADRFNGVSITCVLTVRVPSVASTVRL